MKNLSFLAAIAAVSAIPPLYSADPVSIPPAYNVPANVTVTTTVAAPNPGGWTATIVDPPIENLLSGGEYEPFNFRSRVYAGGDGVNTVPLTESASSGWDTRREGFFNGARVRIYRIIDGKLVNVRNDTISCHRSSGWMPTSFEKIVPQGQTSYQWSFDDYNSPVAPYFFSVVAVAPDGTWSKPSAPAEVKRSQNCEAKAKNEGMVEFKWPEAGPGSAAGAPPATPANFQAATGADGIVTFSWDPVPGAAGYLVLRSDTSPEKHLGYGFDLAGKAKSPGEQIQKGDLVYIDLQRTAWSRNQYAANRVWGTYGDGGVPGVFPGQLDESRNHTWSLVPHPEPIPAELSAAERGRTCLEVTMSGAEEVKLYQYNYASAAQNWYPVLTPGRTYVVEFWAQEKDMANPKVHFGVSTVYEKSIQTDFSLSGDWKKFTYEFVPEGEFPRENEMVGTMSLTFTGPGKLWLDCWRIYPKDPGYMSVPRAEIDDLRASGMAFLRTHGLIKSGWSYTLDDLTNLPGVKGPSGNSSGVQPSTLFSLLSFLKEAKVNPWLQIEMSLSEEEWKGLVEYLAAPYDPAKDTPKTKPWAYKRYSMGQEKPWTDEFSKFLFEVSNETWNPMFSPWNFPWQKMTDAATGRIYAGGELTGLTTSYILDQMKQSPYWPALGPKLESVVGGWGIELGDNGFGQAAVKVAPEITHNLVANYNGGWDEGAAPAAANDDGFRLALTVAPQHISLTTRELAETRDRLAAQGVHYKIGTYEAGPGYSLPSTVTKDQMESESQVMKSLAAGTGTLDCFLDGAQQGMVLQNFFTYRRNRTFWTSHAELRNGGQAYPSWQALTLYNNFGQGDFLVTCVNSMPTDSLPGTKTRKPMKAAPMVGVYATRNNDRYTVFVLSRKMDKFPYPGDDGFTPVTLNLPFTKAKKITLHTIDGDPRANNLDAENIKVRTREIPPRVFDQKFVLNAARGADVRGLPPAAVLADVFEGTQTPELPKTPTGKIQPSIGQPVVTSYPEVRFAILFDRPVTGLAEDKIQITGTTGGTLKLAWPVEWAKSGCIATIEDMDRAGEVGISIAAGAAQDAAGIPVGALVGPMVKYELAKPLDKVFVQESFDIPAGSTLWSGETGTGWKGKWQYHNQDPTKFPEVFVPGSQQPLSDTWVAATPGYLQGGGDYSSAWRLLDFDLALPFAKLPTVKDQPPQIGLKGATVWLSFLVRKETKDDGFANLSLNASDFYKEEAVAARFGYFGNSSEHDGSAFWGMQVRDAQNKAWQTLLSQAPVELGKTALLVVRITFGRQDKFDLYVNPPAGAQPPAEPSATFTSDGSRRLTFDRIVLWGGRPGSSAFDEIRFGDSFRAVAPAK